MSSVQEPACLPILLRIQMIFNPSGGAIRYALYEQSSALCVVAADPVKPCEHAVVRLVGDRVVMGVLGPR